MSVDELVQRHAVLSAEQGRGLDGFSSMIKVNRLAQQISEINSELKSRPGDQRLALTGLFSSPDPWVRLNAARIVMNTAPVEARPVIQQIADSKNYPVAGHAGMCLSFFDGELSDLKR
jgi:hypothetical protein